jgi:hypothetical protein
VLPDVASGRAKSVYTPMSAPGWQYRTVSARPSGAVTKARTSPLMISSRYGALPASRCVTDPADIRLLTEPTMSSSRASGGSARKCDASTAARMSASTAATYDAACLTKCRGQQAPPVAIRDTAGPPDPNVFRESHSAWEHRHQRHRSERVHETEMSRYSRKTLRASHRRARATPQAET